MYSLQHQALYKASILVDVQIRLFEDYCTDDFEVSPERQGAGIA
jgi:hypothetical protein